MITAAVALLANPVTAVAASAIAISAFTCTAILGLFKGGCFMQKVKENVVQQQSHQQIDQQNNQLTNQLDNHNQAYKKNAEERMGHTDLLFEKFEEKAQLDSSKAAGSEQGEGDDEGEGEGESPH